MARRFEITCQLTAYDDSDNPMNVGNGQLVTTTRTGDDSLRRVVTRPRVQYASLPKL